jgi:LacI family transcriptional regulator
MSYSRKSKRTNQVKLGEPCVTLHLLIETSGSYGRGLLRGVAKYNREHGGWSTYFHPHGLGDPPPAWLTNWKGDGILARIETPQIAAVLARSGAAVVNLARHGC